MKSSNSSPGRVAKGGESARTGLRFIKATPSGVELSVRVLPRAGKTGIVGEYDGALKVRIASAPVDGEANKNLIGFFAKLFKVAKGSVKIVSGERSRLKRIIIEGVSQRDIENFLAPLL